MTDKIFQAVFESCVEGIMVINMKGEVLRANPACEEIFGYTPQEMAVVNIEKLIPEEFRKKISKERKKYFQDPYSWRGGQIDNLFALRKNGSTILIEISLSPTIIEGEKVVIAFILDVTERKKTEADNEDFARIIEESLNEIHIIDAKTSKFILMNKVARENLGYRMEELQQLTPNDILPKFTMDSHHRMVEPLLRGEVNELSIETMHQHENGTTYPVESHLQSTTFQGQDVIIATILNINERKKAEQELKQSLKQFKVLSQLASIGIVMTDEKGACIYANDTWQELSGLSLEESLDSGWANAILEEDRELVLNGWQDAIQKKEKFSIEHRLLHSHTNQIKNVLASSTPILDESGNVTGYIAVASDITESKKTRQKLQQLNIELEGKVDERTKELLETVKKLVQTNLHLEDQMEETQAAETRAEEIHDLYQAIVRYLPNAMVVVVDREFKLVSFEGEEKENIGLKEGNVKNKHIDELTFLSTEGRLRAKENIKRTLEGAHLTYDVDFRDQNYRVNSMPFYDSEGQVYQALLVYTNITDQKKIELEMAAALKKEQDLNELKSRFVALASHEFRTPLGVILSAADLIALQNGEGKEERRLKNVGRIKSNVKNLTKLLNEFLSLSKLEEGVVRNEPEIFEIIGFANEIIEELQQSKKVGQEILLSHNQPDVELYLDKQIIHNILLNLLSNAIKYSKENGIIKLGITTNQSTLYIKVEDNGIGIPKEEQVHLFNRFFRAGNAINIEGTGLGLHIVKKYVQLLRGEISVESELNVGTAFTIKVPVANLFKQAS